jgi:small subunit ribosomal protein S16
VAVKLRLMRMGKKKQPTYRVVAADSRSPRDGRFIEIVGIYDPRPDPSAVRIDNDKAVDWLRKGAQPTESVRKLLEISGAWETFSGQPSTRTAPPPAESAPTKAAPSKAAAPEAASAEPTADEVAAETDESAPDTSAAASGETEGAS